MVQLVDASSVEAVAATIRDNTLERKVGRADLGQAENSQAICHEMESMSSSHYLGRLLGNTVQ